MLRLYFPFCINIHNSKITYSDYYATIEQINAGGSGIGYAAISTPDGKGILSVSILGNGYHGGVLQSVTHITSTQIVISVHNFETSIKTNVKIHIRVTYV